MKSQIKSWLSELVTTLQDQGQLSKVVEFEVEVECTKSKQHGDYASNIALVLAKKVGLSPRALAEQLIAAKPLPKMLSEVALAGPGFINMKLDVGYLCNVVDRRLLDPRLGLEEVKAQTIVVDYSSPNLAKEMHVGHLRTTIIGDALARVLGFLGHEIIRQNHVGDWGTQFGMLLAFMEQQEIKDVEDLNKNLADLEIFYRQAKLAFDESESFANRARELVVLLQSGDPYCKQLWEVFHQVSMQHCQHVYQALGVLLEADDIRGESTYELMLPGILEDLSNKGILAESQGAKCVFSAHLKNKEQEPLPLLVQKKGGGYLYATTDLAAIKYRLASLAADRVIYVVDQRQALHFQLVFEVAKQLDWGHGQVQLEHVGFGTVNGADGKPFKTRAGGTTKLIDLLEEAKSGALKLVKGKNPELSDNELQAIADVVGIASVKYADLSKTRTQDYIFSFDKMLSFEGNTAPYLLYAYARINRLLSKVETPIDGEIALEHEAELDLAKELIQFPERIVQVAESCCPHYLCQHLYDIASLFMRFYEQCPILSEAERLQASRLKICLYTANTLKLGLSLLGIDVLDRM